MAKPKIEWIHPGFEEILCDPGTMSEIKAATARIESRANGNNRHGGSGFESGTRLGRAFGSQRAMGFVYTTDIQSKIAEAEDKALSRAVSG